MANRGYPGRSVSPAGGGRGRSSASQRTGGTGRPSDKALIVKGSTGKYSLINGTYEPMGMHGQFPCWTTRSTNPCYLFHTGKTRWVISKALDDGSTCYAFVPDDGCDNPARCRGPWTRCNDKGEWKQDPVIKCIETTVSTDPFVRVRVSLDDEMRKVKISEEADRQQMWKLLDKNGDGAVDLAEVEAFVGNLAKTGVWPSWLNSERALQRAYKNTLEESIDGDDKVEKEEFHALLLNIFWFSKLDEVFQEIDTGDDESLDQHEFEQGMGKLGIQLSPQQAAQEFKNIDTSGDGIVDFGEFCLYIRKRIQPESSDGRSEKDDIKAQAHEHIRAKGGDEVTTHAMVRHKNFADFDALEKQIKAICAEPDNKGLKKLWKRLDFNGNNVVSLAEIDKWVVEQYPLLNHKPALIRAQQATLKAGDGDDWVEKKEFKLLIVNLFYYNKLFWLFDQADEGKDRRMDFKEFQWCLSMCGLKLSPTKAKSEFEKVDTNGGGQILFDEFCAYFVTKHCPDAMTDFIADQ